MTVYPSYYKAFSCIASGCRHSCCVGWEIDIDEDSYTYYQSTAGAIGERLRNAISCEDTPHFVLGEGERCPFLNRDNLCELILTLGEASLCEICREHPRFYNVLSDRVEVGLGLCCEEAARLVLSQKAPMTLICDGKTESFDEWERECLTWRERVFAILQDRTVPILSRLDLLDAHKTAISALIRLLLSLEILTPEWKALLLRYREVDGEAFSRYMQERESEYEQFAVYLAYRYLVTAFDEDGLARKTRLIAALTRLFYALGKLIWAETGKLTFADQVELTRLISVELEYDEDNLQAILEALS